MLARHSRSTGSFSLRSIALMRNSCIALALTQTLFAAAQLPNAPSPALEKQLALDTKISFVLDLIHSKREAEQKALEFNYALFENAFELATYETLFDQDELLYRKQALCETEYRKSRSHRDQKRHLVAETKAKIREQLALKSVYHQRAQLAAGVLIDSALIARSYADVWSARAEISQASYRRSEAERVYLDFVRNSALRIHAKAKATSWRELMTTRMDENSSAQRSAHFDASVPQNSGFASHFSQVSRDKNASLPEWITRELAPARLPGDPLPPQAIVR